LASALLKQDQQLHKVHYFTSRIRSTKNNLPDIQRQTTYLEELACQSGLDIHWGHFLEKPRQCRACGAQWLSYEEKMTDVNMAVQMLTDAYKDLFDTAILISGDSDLETVHAVAGHPVCGLSYEGFCIDNMLAATQARVTPYTYRTHAGAEIDLVLERGGKPWMAIDIKRSTTPTVSKGFGPGLRRFRHVSQRFVVYPGTERFPMRHGAQAMGLLELMHKPALPPPPTPHTSVR
jgi:hypothetical protein